VFALSLMQNWGILMMVVIRAINLFFIWMNSAVVTTGVITSRNDGKNALGLVLFYRDY